MNIEKGMSYTFTFGQLQRFSAARIAYKASLSEGCNAAKAITKAALSFLGRSVTLSAEALSNPGLAKVKDQLEYYQQKSS